MKRRASQLDIFIGRRRPGEGLIIDGFAGFGGASTAIKVAVGRDPDIAINHSALALKVHARNHPNTRHIIEDIHNVVPLDVTRGQPVDMAWFSPDCTHFSDAKGGKPCDQGIRGLADVIPKWARQVRPRLIFVENVRGFLKWGPLHPKDHPNPKLRERPIKERAREDFNRWWAEMLSLGYQGDWRLLRASNFGARTSRLRLFIVFRCDGEPIVWPEPTHGEGLKPFRTAAECIDWRIPVPSIFEPGRDLVPKTMWRIAQGMRRFVFETDRPFIVKSPRGPAAALMVQNGYGERPTQRARWKDIKKPMGTIVAGGVKELLVMAFLAKHYGGHTTPGSSLGNPIDTITARDHHALVTASAAPANASRGRRADEVRAFLTEYYGSGSVSQSLHDPMNTVVSRARFGLVTVKGRGDFVIEDIGMRMLHSSELLRGQTGEYASEFDLSDAPTEKDRIHLIGNSVCPENAIPIIRANYFAPAHRRAA